MAHIHELYDFTASAFILHPTEAKILLLKHRKIGKWLQPGGHIELNENPLQALHHELEEETGLKPSDYEIIQTAEQPQPKNGNNRVLPLPFYLNEHNFDDKHQHIDLAYLVKAKIDTLTEHPDGADAIGWVSLEEIKSLLDIDEIFAHTAEICEWIFKRYSSQ